MPDSFICPVFIVSWVYYLIRHTFACSVRDTYYGQCVLRATVATYVWCLQSFISSVKHVLTTLYRVLQQTVLLAAYLVVIPYVCILLQILCFNLIYILCLFHHISYYFTSFNIACLYDCVYEDLTEKKPSVYFNVHCIQLSHPE